MAVVLAKEVAVAYWDYLVTREDNNDVCDGLHG